MNPIFPVGIHSLWDELNHMPTGGVWWINTDRDDDAYRLANQTITAQQAEARVAVVTQGIAPREVIHAPVHGGPDKIRLFSGRNTPDSLDFFTRDLMSSIDPRHFLILVITPTNYWQNISSAQIHNWLKKPVAGRKKIIAQF